MNPRYDDPALFEALDPAERDALRRALGSEADAADALALWQAIRAHVASGLRADLPDYDLLVLYALGDRPAALAPEEEARLIAEGPTVESALESHPALWAVVERIRADRDAFDTVWDDASEDVGTATVDRRADRPAVRQTRARRVAWRSAVAVAVFAFAALSIYLIQRDAGFETYETAAGEQRTVELADGSTVRLAERSRLRVENENDGQRLVRLTGEALFEVVPNGETFVVETPTALTTVLGTTFGVQASDIETEVVLASGAVELAPRLAPETAVRLEPGQRSRVVGGQAPETPIRTDVAATLAWTGTWYFQATPLDAIAERLAAHYDVDIVVDDAIAADRVTGPFSSEVPVEETLRTLALALDARVEGTTATGFRLRAAE